MNDQTNQRGKQIILNGNRSKRDVSSPLLLALLLLLLFRAISKRQ